MDGMPEAVELRHNNEIGYHLVVTADMPAGSLMLQEVPLVQALSTDTLHSHCRRCMALLPLKLRQQPIQCERCARVRYCCGRCEAADLQLHDGSGECALLMQRYDSHVADAPLVREACAALRLLHAGTQEPPLATNMRPLHGDGALTGREAAQLRATADAVAAARRGVPGAGEGQAAAAVAAVATNGLEVLPVLMGAEGVGRATPGHGAAVALYRLASRINHSCRPTLLYCFKPHGLLQLRASRPLRAGEQLTLCYVNPLAPAAARRAALAERYGFACDCERCGEAAAAGEGESTAAPPDWVLSAVERRQIGDTTEEWAVALPAAGGAHAPTFGAHAEQRWATCTVEAAGHSSSRGGAAVVIGGVRSAQQADMAAGTAAQLEREVAAAAALLLQEDDVDGCRAALVARVGPLLTQQRCHALHAACLDAYALLATAVRVAAGCDEARRELAAPGGGRALAASVLWALLSSAAPLRLLRAGEVGLLPQAARAVADAAQALCEYIAWALRQQSEPLSATLCAVPAWTHAACGTSVNACEQLPPAKRAKSAPDVCGGGMGGGTNGICGGGAGGAQAAVAMAVAATCLLHAAAPGGDGKARVRDADAAAEHAALSVALAGAGMLVEGGGLLAAVTQLEHGTGPDVQSALAAAAPSDIALAWMRPIAAALVQLLAAAVEHTAAAFGDSHPLSDYAAFLPFHASLPPPLASSLTRAASALVAEQIAK